MLQDWAHDRANELPSSQLEHPFGPEWDVFKVRGRVFMLLTALNGHPIVTLKADPADVKALCEAYSQIIPGYHMNKKNWITLRPGGELDQQLVEDLVTESYLLVIEKNVPKKHWPVDPRTFGQGGR